MAQQDAQQNLGEKGDYFENKEITDSEKLIKELSDFEARQKLKVEQEINIASQETFEKLNQQAKQLNCGKMKYKEINLMKKNEILSIKYQIANYFLLKVGEIDL